MRRAATADFKRLGAAALATVVSALDMVAFVFGIGVIVWCAWLGFAMLRRR